VCQAARLSIASSSTFPWRGHNADMQISYCISIYAPHFFLPVSFSFAWKCQSNSCFLFSRQGGLRNWDKDSGKNFIHSDVIKGKTQRKRRKAWLSGNFPDTWVSICGAVNTKNLLLLCSIVSVELEKMPHQKKRFQLSEPANASAFSHLEHLNWKTTWMQALDSHTCSASSPRQSISVVYEKWFFCFLEVFRGCVLIVRNRMSVQQKLKSTCA